MKLKQPICKKQEKIGCIASGKTSRKVQAKYEFVLWPTAKRSFSYIHSCDNDNIAKAEARGMVYGRR